MKVCLLARRRGEALRLLRRELPLERLLARIGRRDVADPAVYAIRAL